MDTQGLFLQSVYYCKTGFTSNHDKSNYLTNQAFTKGQEISFAPFLDDRKIKQSCLEISCRLPINQVWFNSLNLKKEMESLPLAFLFGGSSISIWGIGGAGAACGCMWCIPMILEKK